MIKGYRQREKLGLTAGSDLWRGRRMEDGAPVLVKSLPEGASPSLVARFRREYELLRSLNIPGVARPLALIDEPGSLVMVLEDFPGEPLETLLGGKPLELTDSLRIAVGLAGILTDVHAARIIHQDLRPANVLVAPDRRVCLADFSLACHRAAQVPPAERCVTPPDADPAYISPEQTGRMNRTTDYRTDFYSLGVTFYRMLTGRLPFHAGDISEWVHCHIARVPEPPMAVIPEIPPIVSDLVMKLLAKNAEDRYQTASGLRADLEKCLEKWEEKKEIEPFPLGGCDLSDRLLIPQKLYGREREVDILVQTFNHVLETGKPELVMVAGYSGIGKTSLIRELYQPLVRSRGLFASGKFDQYKRNIPYSTIAEAFRELIRQILTGSEERIASWREQLHRALGANGQLIVELIPQTELVIGPQPPVPELPPTEARNRFNRVFSKFIDVFATREHPLVVFLDDLQWVDSASLKLLNQVVTHPDTRYFLLIGAYRDNEVGPSHSLLPALEDIRHSGAAVRTITLQPLSTKALSRLMVDTLRSDPARVNPLTDLLHEKTGGNPFFFIQFLTVLNKERLLTFDRTQNLWRWDLSGIRKKGYTDNVVDLMTGKLEGLSAGPRQAMRLAACIGNRFDGHTLAVISGVTDEEVPQLLGEALQEGLILPLTETSYRFLHDRVQEAAYSLVPESDRAGLHLRIGRLLLAAAPEDRQEEKVFEIVSQLNRGAGLITDPNEKASLCRLNTLAGRKAKAAIAYQSALAYLDQGMALLPPDAWGTDYDEAFALHLDRAECEYLVGNFGAADALFNQLLARARSAIEGAKVHRLRIRLYQMAGQLQDAVSAVREGLRLFGVILPDSDKAIRAATEAEMRDVEVNLGSRRVGDVAAAPIAADPDIRMIISLVAESLPAAYIARPQDYALLSVQGVNASLRHGNTVDSSGIYSAYAMVLVSVLGDIRSAFEFSTMALELAGRLSDPRTRGVVLLRHGFLMNHWRKPIATSLPYLEESFLTCRDLGDFFHASYAAVMRVILGLEKGDPLQELMELLRRGVAFAKESHLELVYQTMRLWQQFIGCLQGSTRGPTSFDDESFSEADALAYFQGAGHGSAIVSYYVLKQIAFYHGSRYTAALESAAQAASTLHYFMASVTGATHHFYHALTLTALYPEASAAQQQEFALILDEKLLRFKDWAESCPENFAHHHALLTAEIARIEGRELDAEHLYEQSIRSAREDGFLQNEALANELAGRFHLGRGLETIARAYLRNAHHGYLQWGAEGKVKQLDEEFPWLLEEARAEATRGFAAQIGRLDAAMVVKASQAISGEIVLPRLVETLMRMVLANAGAQKGILLLVCRDEMAVAARASVEGEEIRIRAKPEFPIAEALPLSIINYVRRTRESVILDDASAPNIYSGDEYIVRNRPVSVLCLPIVKRAAPLGLLYLENNLVKGAFTAERLEVLEVLAAQAAISLENSTLYEALQGSRHLLQSIIDNSAAVIYVKDLEGRYLLVNRRFEELFHVTRESVAGRTDYDLFSKERADAYHAFDERVIAAGTSLEAEEEVPQDDRVHTYISIKAPIRDKSEKVHAVCGISTDITERKQIDRMKDEFISTAAHELRTPLTTVLGYLQLLLESELTFSPQERREFLELVYRNSEALARIVDDLHDLSTAQAGRLITLERSRQDLAALAERAVAAWRGLSDRHRFILEFPQAPVDLCLDPGKINQVLDKLLSNAVKFSPNGGAIRVSGERTNGEFRITIEDEGIGMRPEEVARVFDKFYRADASDTALGGLGLGMRIVRNIVEAHGGRIWVESEEGRGTRVHFTLPLQELAGKCPLPLH
jgi:PAS domain S-box-containing protein